MKRNGPAKSFAVLLAIVVVLAALAACGDASTPSPESSIETPALAEQEQSAGPATTSTTPPATTEPTSEPFMPVLEPSPCPMQLPEGAVEGENLLCSTVEVPERHAAPEGKTIRLTVALVKSTSDVPADDPLVMLAGGPGDSALTSFPPLLFQEPWQSLRADRDVVLIEQRGTRYTEPFLFCDEVADYKRNSLAQNLKREARRQASETATRECRNRLLQEGVDLSAYNSLENAADVAAILRAMGYNQVNLYGGSYGSMLAQHLMREDPDLLRSVILDAVAPLRHEPNVLYKAHAADRSLRLVFERCASDPACSEAYPDLEEVFFATVAQLDAEPATVQLIDRTTRQPLDMLLTGERLVTLTRDFLYATNVLPYLPKIITSAAAGDYALLASIQSGIQSVYDRVADGMYKSVVCSELVDFTAEDLASSGDLYPEVAQVMEDLITEIWPDTCQVWEVEPLDASVKTSVRSDLPTLVLSGEFDPTVPPAMGEVVAEALANAYVYTLPNVSHGTLNGGACPVSIMVDFLADPVQAPDTGCTGDIELAFVLPPQLADIALEPAVREDHGLRSVVPTGWIQAAPGHYLAPDASVEIAFAHLQEDSDTFLSQWGSPEVLEEQEINGRVWTMYQIELPDATGRGFTALSQAEEGLYMVIALTNLDQVEAIRDSVFLPMVQEFRVSGQAAAFSYAAPQQVGMPSAALEELASIVQGYVDEDLVVGAELMVLKDRQVVLHEAFGWKNREDEVPMEPGTLVNIRSMTKPVTAMAILMLAEEGKLALDDPVATYLPAFDNDKSRDITIEHLLTHRSGLPLSMALTGLDEYENLQELASAGGEQGPDFEPGTAFQYSDAGYEALGALVEVISGMGLDEFIQARILNPLGMDDTVTMVQGDDPRSQRIASLYFGGQDNWTRFWTPEDDPIYPYPLGSQSLYTTALDYARFLALWMDRGQLEDGQLLSPETVAAALRPASEPALPGSFPGLRLDYGQGWIVYLPEDALEGEGDLVLFGHSGSDGTWAWAWPEQDLMILYLTQSRGQGSGINLEDEIDRLLIHPDRLEAEIPEELEPYLGTYTALSGPLRNMEFEILVQNGRLAVNLPQKIVVPLNEPEGEDGLWRLSVNTEVAVEFVRDEAGEVTALLWHEAGQVFELPRGTAPEEQPLTLEEVEKYLGTYLVPEDDITVELVFQNGRLAVLHPNTPIPLELFPPGEDGRWYMRLNPAVSLSFQEDDAGQVVSFTAHAPDGDFVRPRIEDSEQ